MLVFYTTSASMVTSRQFLSTQMQANIIHIFYKIAKERSTLLQISSSVFPAMSLGFTISGEILAYVTFLIQPLR